MDIHLTLFGDIVLTPTLVTSLIVIALLMLFFIICGIIINKADPTKPSKGLMAVLEIAYNGVEGFIRDSVGDKAAKYIPFIFTVASYLVLANLMGLFGFLPPTTEFSITLSLTIVTLTYILLAGIIAKGFGGYLKDTYLGNTPWPMWFLFVPINIIGELSKIISLSFRLFGNIMSGALLLGLVLQLFRWLIDLMPAIGWLSALILPFLNAYFDIFAGLMQAFIFCTLTMVFIKGATEREV